MNKLGRVDLLRSKILLLGFSRLLWNNCAVASEVQIAVYRWYTFGFALSTAR